MTYAEAVSLILALRGGELAGMRSGLERIVGLLDAIGNPERRYGIIQVAGTNGKGSVAAMIASILKAAGLRVGLYTSPHLCSFRERIRVNGEAIPESDVAGRVKALRPLVESFDTTMFEAATALALDHFARSKVKIAVLEVGMGGRLDATTVGKPLVSVITRIAHDHQAHLGWSIEEIAREKAAIIRSGRAVAGAQAQEVTEILLRSAESAGVPLLLEGRDLTVSVSRDDLSGQRIGLAGPAWNFAGVWLPLLGSFQPGNALLAVAAVKELGASGIRVSEAALREGLARVRWPGRFQVAGRNPFLILDGAHNPAGAQALAASLGRYFPDAPKTMIVGVSSDKDKAGILKCLAPLATRLILTASSHPRATPPGELLALLPPIEGKAETSESVAEALSLAQSDPGTPVICVSGSLFTVADALSLIRGDRDIPCGIEGGIDSIESLFS
jgi:dihydrofolate synthase/folylpolyglutamate synthase